MAKDELDLASATFAACAGRGTLQNAQFEVELDAEVRVEGEDGSADGVGGDVTGGGGRGDDAGAGEKNVHGRFREGSEEAHWNQEVGDAPCAAGWELMLDDTSACAIARSAASNQTGSVEDSRTGHREFDGGAIGDVLEETEEGDFMVGKAGVGGGGGADV